MAPGPALSTFPLETTPVTTALPPIPGTTLFDGAQARKGYALNKMCFSFNDEANRKALAARLHYALSFEQDPWKERIETPQLKKEFDTIKVVQIEEATV